MKRYIKSSRASYIHYDKSLESEIFEYLDLFSGYSDYNQKVEDVADEWNLPLDIANVYVWNWSIRLNI